MHRLMFLPSSLKKGILFSVDGEVFVKSGLGPRSFSLREQLGVWAVVASGPWGECDWSQSCRFGGHGCADGIRAV